MSLREGQHGGEVIRKRQDYRISLQLPKLLDLCTSDTYVVGEDGILPYMARVHSPVRVTFSQTPTLKEKSKISNQTLRAMFKFRPVKKGERINVSRFKSPESTQPSLQYLSPWVPITKGDYSDPRQNHDGQDSLFLNSRASTRASTSLPRSVMDLDFNFMQDRGGGLSENSSSIRTNTFTAADSELQSKTGSSATRSISAKTQSSDKRVTFSEISDFMNKSRLKSRSPVFLTTDERPKPVTQSKRHSSELVDNEIGNKTDSYSGDLSSGLSEQTDDDFHLGSTKESMSIEKPYSVLVKEPLVGDRSLFVRGSYTTKPVIYHSDIDQIRFEGHKQLTKLNGQSADHFSMFKDRGSLIKPKNKGMYLEEALKKQHILPKSADNSKLKRYKTSIDILERQGDRTY